MNPLDAINDPAELRGLPRTRLAPLARQLRQFLLDSVSRTGGHLSSNLGSVELTIALHYVFDTPRDRLVWDVGHQCYGHKVLTGRREHEQIVTVEEGAAMGGAGSAVAEALAAAGIAAAIRQRFGVTASRLAVNAN